MEIDFETVDLGTGDSALIALVEGAVDTQTVNELERILTGKLNDDGYKYQLLDFAQVKYINSTGMGTMVKMGDTFRNAGGDICLINVNPKVKELFSMLGLLAVIKIYDSREEGLSYLTGIAGSQSEELEPDLTPQSGSISSGSTSEPSSTPSQKEPAPSSASSPVPSSQSPSPSPSPAPASEEPAAPSGGGQSFDPVPAEEDRDKSVEGLDLTFHLRNLSDGGGAIFVDIEGAIDTRTIKAFETEVMNYANEGLLRIALDFEKVKYINSTGMGTLVKLGDVIRDMGGEIFIVNLSPKIRELFDMLGLLPVIKSVDTEEEAKEKFLAMSGGPGGGEEAPAESAAPAPQKSPVASFLAKDKEKTSSPAPPAETKEEEAPAEEKKEAKESAPTPAASPAPAPTAPPKPIKKAGGAVGVEFIPDVVDFSNGQKVLTIEIKGALDAATVKPFEDQIMEFANQGYIYQILDFAQVKYINSTGMGTMVKLGDTLREKGGDLFLVKVDTKVKELFNMLGLLPVIKIEETEDDALELFSEQLGAQPLAEGEVPAAPPASEEAEVTPPAQEPEEVGQETSQEPPTGETPSAPASPSAPVPTAESPGELPGQKAPTPGQEPALSSEFSVEEQRMQLIQEGKKLDREGKHREAIEKWEEAKALTEYKEGLQRMIDKAKAKLEPQSPPPAPAAATDSGPSDEEDFGDDLDAQMAELSAESPAPSESPAAPAAPETPPPAEAPSSDGSDLDAIFGEEDSGEAQPAAADSGSESLDFGGDDLSFVDGDESSEAPTPGAESTPPAPSSEEGVSASPAPAEESMAPPEEESMPTPPPAPDLPIEEAPTMIAGPDSGITPPKRPEPPQPPQQPQQEEEAEEAGALPGQNFDLPEQDHTVRIRDYQSTDQGGQQTSSSSGTQESPMAGSFGGEEQVYEDQPVFAVLIVFIFTLIYFLLTAAYAVHYFMNLK